MAMLAYVTCLRAQMRCKVPDQTVHWGRKGLKRKRWTDMVYRETDGFMRPAADRVVVASWGYLLPTHESMTENSARSVLFSGYFFFPTYTRETDRKGTFSWSFRCKAWKSSTWKLSDKKKHHLSTVEEGDYSSTTSRPCSWGMQACCFLVSCIFLYAFRCGSKARVSSLSWQDAAAATGRTLDTPHVDEAVPCMRGAKLLGDKARGVLCLLCRNKGTVYIRWQKILPLIF